MKQKINAAHYALSFYNGSSCAKTVTVISKMATRGYYSITYKVSGNSYHA